MSEATLTEEADARRFAGPAARGGGVRVPAVAIVWLALIAAGAALRLAALDALPLTFGEAGRALQALAVSQNTVPDGWSGDLAAALTSYVFRAFGDSELTARLVPAIGGALMVATLPLLGCTVGRTGALVTGVLLAFSPLAVLSARSAETFSVGMLVAVGMVASLFAYLREPRALSAFAFAVALGLAPSTDAVATTAALACGAFLLLESIVSRGGMVAQAWGVMRRSPSHWLSVVLVLAAAVELGLTHFGTSLGRSGLAGLTQWGDMFALPRDGREPEYPLALLVAYEWPVLLAGVTALAVFAWRLRRGGFAALSPAQRLALVWTVVAALAVGLATRREAGHLLMLTVPLALLAGLLAEGLLPSLEWSVLRRWWPLAAGALALLAYAALLTTDWARHGLSDQDRVLLVLAVGGAGVLLSAGYSLLGRDSAAIVAVVGAALAFVFLAHTNLGFVRDEGAVEAAVDIRTSGRIDLFEEAVREIDARRQGVVFVDPTFRSPLGWYLRDLPVVFGPIEEENAAVVVAAAGEEIEGFTPVGKPWRLGESWYPLRVKTLPLWRWLLYREPYGGVEGVDAQIMVAAP